MNNYLKKLNYFNNDNQSSNFFGQTYNNLDGEYDDLLLYNPYQGFIRGNMFENIYDSYKIKNPFEFKPINEQAELLTYLNSLSFACIDLNLYLDVNPNDRKAIDIFNKYRVQKESLLKEYQDKYGPICLNSNSLNVYPWSWNDKSWPWEL